MAANNLLALERLERLRAMVDALEDVYDLTSADISWLAEVSDDLDYSRPVGWHREMRLKKMLAQFFLAC